MSMQCATLLLASKLSVDIFVIAGAVQIEKSCEVELDDSSSFLQVQSDPSYDDVFDQQDDRMDAHSHEGNKLGRNKETTEQDDSIDARLAQNQQHRPHALGLVQLDMRSMQGQRGHADIVTQQSSTLDAQFAVDNRQDQGVAPQRSQLVNRDVEDAYGKSGQEVASSNKNREEVSSLAVAKMLLDKERERVRDLEEYVRLADSNNRKLAALEEQHAEELRQYRSNNARLHAELADIRERCKNEIEQVFAYRNSEAALLQIGGAQACVDYSKNGASPVTDVTSCGKACQTGEGIGCEDGGCYYHGLGANASKCECPIRVRVKGKTKVASSRSLCQDVGYDSALGDSLSLVVVIGMFLSLAS